jgi:hypothetical protein
MELEVSVISEEGQNRAAAADFNIIGMSAKTENSEGCAAVLFKGESKHLQALSGRCRFRSATPATEPCPWHKDHPDAACP